MKNFFQRLRLCYRVLTCSYVFCFTSNSSVQSGETVKNFSNGDTRKLFDFLSENMYIEDMQEDTINQIQQIVNGFN